MCSIYIIDQVNSAVRRPLGMYWFIVLVSAFVLCPPCCSRRTWALSPQDSALAVPFACNALPTTSTWLTVSPGQNLLRHCLLTEAAPITLFKISLPSLSQIGTPSLTLFYFCFYGSTYYLLTYNLPDLCICCVFCFLPLECKPIR